MHDLFDLTGKVAVVTGGNRGIGLGIARGLAKAGATLSIWSRDESRNETAAQELAALGATVETHACDVSREEDVRRCTEATVENLGRIDISVANAGYGAGHNPLNMSLEDWRSLLSVNFDGAFLTMRDAARHMKERGGGGKLIAISSISEIFGAPKQAHYAAGKAGLSALVRSLSVELARYDIQVNSILPGWIITEATEPARRHEPLNEIVMKRTPARRWGTTEDLEGIAVYLASNASNFHTGDSLRVDGGYSVF
jgi:NAD(P)-dependent dehydrogenase (short-subunit alcohol dehydrogenase family)